MLGVLCSPFSAVQESSSLSRLSLKTFLRVRMSSSHARTPSANPAVSTLKNTPALTLLISPPLVI